MEIGGDDRRNELCRRFRESLVDKSAVLFYDEDELIEIFDYAGDLNDDYLRTEALLLGARLYPDSQALKERRAVLYSAFGSDMAAKYLDDNASVEGALWDIMRLRKQLPVGDEAGKALDSLVARYDLFDDEEIIQLTDLASKLGRYDWLVSRLGMLRKKTTYQPTLIFEVAVIAELNNDFKEAIKLLDELTQIEPYNYQYWQMLAELQKKDGDNDGAMSSLEMALAINPDDASGEFYLCRLLCETPGRMRDAAVRLEKLYKAHPEDPDIAHYYLMALTETGGDPYSERSFAILSDSYRHNPGHRQIATDMLAVDHPDAVKAIAESARQQPIELDDWLDWASHFSSIDAPKQANVILGVAREFIGRDNIDINGEMIFNCFVDKDFRQTVEIYERNMADWYDFDRQATLAVMYAVSLVKLHRLQQATVFASGKLIEWHLKSEPVDARLECMSASIILSRVAEIARRDDAAEIEAWDPMYLW